MAKKIIIHCSDSKWGNAIAINSWHIERGFDCIGYHYVILNGRTHNSKDFDDISDGLIETGRRYNKNGAHVKGHNRDSIGICLIGTPGNYTEDQYMALKLLILGLKEKYTNIALYEHSDFDPKKPFCASLNWSKLSNENHDQN